MFPGPRPHLILWMSATAWPAGRAEFMELLGDTGIMESYTTGAMNERRATTRQRTLKTGMISFDRAAGIDCTIRNISDTGAALDVASPIGIPDHFVLVIGKENLKRPCHVAWRSARRIGVRFD
jgi:hypothetical protein